LEPLSHDVTREVVMSEAVIGTVPYMSPEQALGKQLDHRSDLFSLGVVLYEMATGCQPFSGSTWFEAIDRTIHSDPRSITSINPKIPPSLQRLIMQCLEKRPEDRIQTAAELASELRKSESHRQFPSRSGTTRNNLPPQLTRFVGRQSEIAEIRNGLTHTRLLTLSGPDGIGKTRLALQVAADSLPEYPEGVWFVELASLADPGLVPQTVASALGLREEGGRSITDTVVDHLTQRCLLLVLDNCEHLIGACAHLTDLLLRRSPHLRVLATSREALGISGETMFRVPSLALPDPQRQSGVKSLSENESVELFVDRARAVKSTFAISAANAGSLAKLCVQLDGIPLAIELAASRMKVLSIEQIADRLHDRLHLLTGGSRTAPSRHQTLLAAIDWSYNLLTGSEKILFHRLSVFAGGWTLEAAETVCAGGSVNKANVLELLSGLVDKSLVLAEEREGQQRYRFMVTLLEYAHRRLTQTEEREAVIRRHADYFVAFAVEGESKLTSTEQKRWLDRLNAEHYNLRAVLTWALKNNAEIGLRLAGALGRFWYMRGYWDEAQRWLAEMLAAKDSLGHSAQRARALNAAARIAENLGKPDSARSFAEQALTLSRESGDKREAAMALSCLAVVAGRQGDFALTRSLLEESLTIRRELGDKVSIAQTLISVGILALRQGEFESAQSRFEDSLAISREVGDKQGIARALVNIGQVAKRLGEHALAQFLTEEGLALANEIGDKTLIPVALNSLGDLAACRGDRVAARALNSEGLEISRELGDRRLIADMLLSLGVVAEDLPTARLLFEESLAIRRELRERPEIAIALNCLGGVRARQGDLAAGAVTARRRSGDLSAVRHQGRHRSVAQRLGRRRSAAR
jgi:predicted ATPase